MSVIMTLDQLEAILTLPTITPETVSRLLGTPVDDVTPFLTLRAKRRAIRRLKDPDERDEATDALTQSLEPNPRIPARKYNS